MKTLTSRIKALIASKKADNPFLKGRLHKKKNIILLVCIVLGMSAYSEATSRGGSAYMWYSSGTGPNYTDYYCYGVVKNYNNSTARSIIQSALQTMYNNGQRKLTVMVFYQRSPNMSACTDPAAVGDSAVSDLQNFDSQYFTNLKDYLSYATSIGYEEFVVIMSPQYLNWPNTWQSFSSFYSSGYYAENWYALTQVRAQLDSASLWYRVILADEPFLNPSCSQCMVDYVYTMWTDYYNTYGSDVYYTGVTIAPDGTYNQTYTFLDIVDYAGFGRPYLYFANMFNDTYDKFWNFSDALASRGATTEGIVIPSTFYNDYTNASNLYWASNDSGRPIHYVIQWPRPVPGVVHDMSAFNNYISWGF